MEKEQVYGYIEEFQRQDFQHFDQFYEALKKDVFYNILGMVPQYEDAEEILQETFVTFLQNVAKVNGRQSPLGYLFRISYNLSQDYYRKRKRESYLEPEHEERLSEEDAPSALPELLQKIRSLLNEKEYEIFLLKSLHDYSHQEIATMLRRPLGTITWSYNQAVKKLKKGLGASYE